MLYFCLRPLRQNSFSARKTKLSCPSLSNTIQVDCLCLSHCKPYQSVIDKLAKGDSGKQGLSVVLWVCSCILQILDVKVSYDYLGTCFACNINFITGKKKILHYHVVISRRSEFFCFWIFRFFRGSLCCLHSNT